MIGAEEDLFCCRSKQIKVLAEQEQEQEQERATTELFAVVRNSMKVISGRILNYQRVLNNSLDWGAGC